MLSARRSVGWSLLSALSRGFSGHRQVAPELVKFIEDENKRFDKFLTKTEAIRASLYDEAVNMLIPEGMSPPELNKGYYYFQRYDEEGRIRFCRVPADSTNIESAPRELEEEILSVGDVAKTFSSNGFADISAAKISVDNQHLGFVVDLKGNERWTLMFRDLHRHEYVEGLEIPLVRNFEWIDNVLTPGRYLYFTELDPVTLRSVRVVRADLCNIEASRTVVYELDPSDTSSYVDLFKSKDGKCIFMSSSSKTRSEVYVVSSDDPYVVPHRVHSPEDGVEYYCEHRDGYIYMVSNKDYTNFALYRKPVDGSKAMELMYHSPDMTIRDIDMFHKGLALYGHGFEGQPAVEVIRFKGCVDVDTVPEDLSDYDAFDVADIVKIPFKGNYGIGKVEVGVNGDFESDTCRFTFRSVKNPGTCLEFRFMDRKLEAIKSREFQRKGGIDMTVDRVGVASMDGLVEIPLTLVCAQTDDEKPRRCLVHVYGAYGQVLEPDFSPAVISLLKRGWTVAFAHVRGGGERGPDWHSAGSKRNRWKSVTDFEACCRWLISEKITTSSQLYAAGASAGGVVLGSALNIYGKSLIGGGAILRVPFVDLFETLKDPSLPLSSHEVDEWGNVNDSTDAMYIESISPIDNLVSDEKLDWYPPIFITSAHDDARVPYEGVVKYAMKLRQRVSNGDHVLVKTYLAGEGGHFGSVSSAGDYNDTCTELAFLST